MSRFGTFQRRFRRGRGSRSICARVLRRCAPGRQFTLCKRGKMRFFSKSTSAVPSVGRHRFGAQNAPHIFFCLGKRKRAAPGTKENRFFSGLLVRPAKMGLVSSSCAEPLARPVRSRRNCPVSNNLLVQIGLLSATAPLPLSGQQKNVYAPAGRNLLRMPGLAAAAQEGPRVLFAPSCLHPMQQMRRKRHGSSGQ